MSGTPVKVIFPSGMLGSGFDAATVPRGIDLGATAIAIDAGSTDSGPFYLGADQAKSARAAIKRDLRLLLTAARGANIPLVVGSCGTSGTDRGVDWAAEIVEEISAEQGLSFTLARVYSEQSADELTAALRAGRIHALPPAGDLDEETLQRCEHIVGLMGAEPMMAALTGGADVVLAGRASDTSMVAALALMNELPAGPAWHAAKTVECGDQCTTNPRGGGVLVEIDEHGFTVAPLDPETSCTPASVAAHMLYENANPFRLLEPSGALDTSSATYTALDDRTVRVEGSRFEQAPHRTIKLEGSASTGYETMSFVGIADPAVLADLDRWLARLEEMTARRVYDSLGIDAGQYMIHLRCYGNDAVLGALQRPSEAPREVGVMMRVRAQTQEDATAIAKTANPLLLHLPLDGALHLPSFAFATSPAETDRGATYEFVLNHIIDIDDPLDLFRIKFSEVRHD